MSAERGLQGRAFVVLGGGVVGLSLARVLRRRGADVLLIEARRTGGGASGAAAGILPAPLGGRSHRARLVEAAHRGYERFVAEVVEESGKAIEFSRPGFAEAALEPEEEAALLARCRKLRAAGVEARWLDSAALRALAPGVSEEARGALHLPGTAWVHPPQLCEALRKCVERSGVEIREGRPAHLERAPRAGDPQGGWDVVLGGQGGERISGREALVAAGAFSGEMVEAAGNRPAAPIRPIRGQMAEVELASPLLTILEYRGVYVIPRPGGAAWVGATVEDVGFDEGLSEAGLAGLLLTARLALPGIGRVVRAWAGLRPKLLRRGGPLIGEGDPPVLAGHYKSGIHLGPLTAELLAARLTGAG